MKNSIFLFFIIFMCSCLQKGEKSNDAQIKTTYFPSGKIMERYHVNKKGELDGPFEIFYENGKLNHQGKMYEGRKKGTVKFYDSISGELLKFVNYVILTDKPGSFTNEVIYFKDNGTSVDHDAPNLYYEIGVVSDTINLGDSFFYSVKIHHPYYKEHKIYICDFDSMYKLLDRSSCGYSIMKNKEFSYVAVPPTKGKNWLRGYIQSDVPINPQDTASVGKFTQTYFEKSYYVR